MKKTIILVLLTVFLVLAISSCSSNNETPTEHDREVGFVGYYIVTNEMLEWGEFIFEGCHKFISDGNNPATLVDISEAGNLFDELQSGDKIEITFETIINANPSGTFYNVGSCRIIEKGKIDDVPQYVIEGIAMLEGIGWSIKK